MPIMDANFQLEIRDSCDNVKAMSKSRSISWLCCLPFPCLAVSRLREAEEAQPTIKPAILRVQIPSAPGCALLLRRYLG